MSGSRPVGAPALLIACARGQRTWLPARPTSSLLPVARLWVHYCGPRAPCRSFLLRTPDPVGAGFVESLARPGGNATGFSQFEYGISSKWLELLKEIAPRVTRAAVLRDSTIPAGIGQFAVLQAVAPSFGLDLRPVDVRDAREIDRAVSAFARAENGSLVVVSGGLSIAHRGLITTLAARHSLPAVYSDRLFVTSGGLMSYGPIRSTIIAGQRVTSIASSRAKSRPTCRCRRRPNTT